ncbi:hypothetical protein BJI48_09140 [Helicobacter sp. 11S02596-1]|nr:hypothetical protein BJI48_09140 [Helicobacter sp. 11S02596-1]
MLSNPFGGSNNSFEAMIKKAMQYKYADNGEGIQTDALNALEATMLTDEKTNNDVYAQVIGGYYTGSGKSMVYGGNMGYDRFITDNVILGFYLGYAYAKSSASKENNQRVYSHNAQAGIYSRIIAGHNEIDISLNNNTAFINNTEKLQLAGMDFNQEKDTMNNTTNLSLSYGYAFGLHTNEHKGALIIKPTLGVSGGYSINRGYKEKGLAFEQKGSNAFSANASIGLELRKYFQDGGFFYIVPGADFELYNSLSAINYNLGGIEIVMPLEDKKYIYGSLFAGGEFKITSSLSGFGSIGAKVASADRQYYSGSLGVRLKF